VLTRYEYDKSSLPVTKNNRQPAEIPILKMTTVADLSLKARPGKILDVSHSHIKSVNIQVVTKLNEKGIPLFVKAPERCYHSPKDSEVRDQGITR